MHAYTLRVVIGLTLALLSNGCSPANTAQVAPGTDSQKIASGEGSGDSAPPSSAPPSSPDQIASGADLPPRGGLPPETWGVQTIGGAKVGHTHFSAEAFEQDGETLWRLTSTMKLKLQRFGQPVTQEVKYTSVETPSGELRSCRVDDRGAGDTKVIEGRVDGGVLVMRVTTQGGTEESRLDWKPEFGGFFAAELSLLRKPLQPGEVRTIRALAPLFNEVSEVRLTAGEYETTKMLAGSERLLRVESSTQLGPSRIQEDLWLDDRGNKDKSVMALGPGIELASYRTTRDVALREGGTANFDLGNASVVKLDRALPQPHTHRRIVYRVHLNGGDIGGVFVSEGSQQVRVIDDSTAEVTVQAIRPGQPPQLAKPGAGPTDAERGPNALIQSDDAGITAMAAKVAVSSGAVSSGAASNGAALSGEAGEDDPWKLALALERHVHGAIRSKNFSQAFATAAEVCRSLEGDCTEHAVLLAALCRARGIPARVAIGLVYYPQARGFAYHMWNEVWIADRWIPLDGTLGQGGIGAAHLKLAQSSLKGANAYSAFLPVFQVLGKLDVKIDAIE